MTRRLVCTVGAVFVLTASATAQTGSIAGTVVDATSELLPGATVVLSGPSSETTTATGPRGTFRFDGLVPGVYRMVTVQGVRRFGRSDATG